MRRPPSAAAIARHDRKRGFTDADVMAMVNQGERSTRIGAHFKISRGVVRRIARQNGHLCHGRTGGNGRDMDWSEDQIQTLIRLWDVRPKISCEKIGIQMGLSKNAICGKAGRLNLPKRPGNGRSPDGSRERKNDAERRRMAQEKYQETARQKKVAEREKYTKFISKPQPPRMEDVIENLPPIDPAVMTALPPPRIIPTTPAPPPVSRPPPPSMLKPAPPPSECCWPIGEPGKRGFRYCDAPAAPRAPYCDEHCREGYSARRPQEEARA